MYMCIRQYPIVWGAVDEIVRRTVEAFLPLIRALPGFVAYEVMDPGDGTVVTVSVFRSKEDADESTRRAAAWVDEALREVVVGPPQIISGPVVVDGRTASTSYSIG